MSTTVVAETPAKDIGTISSEFSAEANHSEQLVGRSSPSSASPNQSLLSNSPAPIFIQAGTGSIPQVPGATVTLVGHMVYHAPGQNGQFVPIATPTDSSHSSFGSASSSVQFQSSNVDGPPAEATTVQLIEPTFSWPDTPDRTMLLLPESAASLDSSQTSSPCSQDASSEDNELRAAFAAPNNVDRRSKPAERIITHVIDDFLLEESRCPFPVTPPPSRSTEDSSSTDAPSVESSVASVTEPPSLPSSTPATKSSTSRPPILPRKQPASSTSRGSNEVRRCQQCGRITNGSQEKPGRKGYRFCSTECSKQQRDLREQRRKANRGPSLLTLKADQQQSSGADRLKRPTTGVSKLASDEPAAKLQKIAASPTERLPSPSSTSVSPCRLMLAPEKPIRQWSVEDVKHLVVSLCDEQCARRVVQERIDGEALVILFEDGHLDRLGFPLGPKVKLEKLLSSLLNRS